ncbi:hypothetical protein R1T43_09965 [Alteromonas sp. CI.11.F.A3]|uniref:hypothetical protein n=1 Tax=Alteromonas sp. CI.11.F.A3 TaxID=3079555 RepID=UPI002942C170|nr:hypothetical protein [Alteromonas sp. CI.11.F.A3]WOI39329.1 hypothetical protein R1T43_09965 [Alteromonas sp. CI.11.F.A3]
MPQLIGQHDKVIISCTDVEEDGYISSTSENITIEELIDDNVVKVTIYTFSDNKGMIVVERHGISIANFNFDVLSAQHTLVQAFMLQNRAVAQITSALVNDAFRGYGISRACYSLLSRQYVVCSDEKQTLDGAALWYFNIPKIDGITMHIVYRYDKPDYMIDEWASQKAWSGDNALVNFALDSGIPATCDEDHSKTVFVAVPNFYPFS